MRRAGQLPFGSWQRLSQLGLMLAMLGLCLWGWPQLDLGRFVIAFVAIDLLGYLPGAWAFRRSQGAPIAPIYHHLYNLCHSYLTAAVVLGVWTWLHGGLEPAMAAIPLHLAGDRALFGNFSKPVALPFEPRPGPPVRARILTEVS